MKTTLAILLLAAAMPAFALWGSFGSGAGDLSGGGAPAGGDYLNIPEYNSTVLLCEFTNSASTLGDNSYYGLQAITNSPGGAGAKATWYAETNGISTYLDFDGSADYVQVEDNANLSFGDASTDSPFSIASWINMDDASSFRILGKYQGDSIAEYFAGTTTSDDFLLSLSDADINNYRFRVTTSPMTSYENVWVFCVSTYDGTNINLYINGALQAMDAVSESGYTAMHNTAAPLRIGMRNQDTPSYADGSIDMPMIFSTNLTANDVSNLFWQTCWNNPTNEYDGVQINPGKGKLWWDYTYRNTYYRSAAGLYRLNYGSANPDPDESLNGNYITSVAGWGGEGSANDAWRTVNGTDKGADCPVVSDLNTATSGWFGVSCYMDTDDGNKNVPIALGVSSGSGTALWIENDLSDDKFKGWCYVDGSPKWIFETVADSTDPYITNWCHLAIQHDGVSPTFYINGVTQAVTFTDSTDVSAWYKAVATDATTDADGGRLGSLKWFSGDIYPFDGKIDDAGWFTDPATSNVIHQFATNSLATKP